MDTVTHKNVHNRFRLNGYHLTKEDLCRIAYSFVKEGEDFEQTVGDFLLDWFDDKPYIDMNTSGTTGTPKSIRIEKSAMVKSALATGDFFGLQPGDRVLHCLPANYVAGKMMFVRSFILGLDMDFVPPSSHPLDHNDEKYDFSAMVPLQAKNSIDKLSNIKKVIIGGVKVHKSLEDELVKLPIDIYETYGMTETITHIAAKKVGVEVFTTLPNVTVSVNEDQCLEIVAKNIGNEKIVTNDIVKLVSDTQFVWLGRHDNVINSGGVKIMPELVENKLSALIPRRYFVIGVPDDILGEKVALYVEGSPLDINHSLFDVLDKYEKPKEIVFIPKFKETATGKIMREESKELVAVK
ncbi:AMP-binding protein [Flavobacterium gilvum]|uniref:O-succinylbenzoic acid--CoA ligase n=1 Tax=Flavobacterium gilvum TaxID=1492737 RepID=A0AAC9N7H9_9FLAO|nr:AMP-binding protein [Flavobacterium gilvum]AOW10513.1 O-succinylbenzoic acid--CoA ligase [Flavobacterium gilvum]KFC59988.1 O-succinylbenzoic acid--CoA ligase [Flavobacterium gilvum]